MATRVFIHLIGFQIWRSVRFVIVICVAVRRNSEESMLQWVSFYIWELQLLVSFLARSHHFEHFVYVCIRGVDFYVLNLNNSENSKSNSNIVRVVSERNTGSWREKKTEKDVSRCHVPLPCPFKEMGAREFAAMSTPSLFLMQRKINKEAKFIIKIIGWIFYRCFRWMMN